MGQRGAFGLAGGPGGVDDDCGVVVGALDDLFDRIGASQELVEPARLDEDAFGARHSASVTGGLLEADPAEHHLRAGVGQEVGHLAALEERVHRHHHRSETQPRPIHDREVHVVGQLHPDPVTRSDTVGAQQPGSTGDHDVERLVAEGLIVETDGGSVRRIAGGGGLFGGEVGHRATLSKLMAGCVGEPVGR